MPNLIWTEPGTDATQDTSLFDATSGTADSQAAPSGATGPRALRLTQLSTARKNGILAQDNRRISYRLRMSSLESVLVYTSKALRASDSEVVWALGLAGGNVLTLFNNSGTQIGNTGSTLVAGTWYRISITWDITSNSVNVLKVFLDGVLDITATNVDLLSILEAGDIQLLGCSGGGGDSFYRDIYDDDGSGLDDVGDVKTTAKRPVSNGAANQFNTQIGSGGSGYGSGRSPQVNERPLSETNGWRDTLTGAEIEAFTLEGTSVGDVDVTGVTILGHMGWVRAKVSSASVAAKLIDNGTEYDVTLTTSPATYFQAVTSSSYPSNSNGIGLKASTTANTDLYECGTIIAYTPSTFAANLSIPAFIQASGAPTAAMIMLARIIDYPLTAIAAVFPGVTARQLAGVYQAKGAPLPPPLQAAYILDPSVPIGALFRPPPGFSASLYVPTVNQQGLAPIVIDPDPVGFSSG